MEIYYIVSAPFFVPFLYKTRVESGPKIETLISRTVFHINKIDTVKKAIALCERSYVDVVLVQVQSGVRIPYVQYMASIAKAVFLVQIRAWLLSYCNSETVVQYYNDVKLLKIEKRNSNKFKSYS